MQCTFIAGQRVVCKAEKWFEVSTSNVVLPPRAPRLAEVCKIVALIPTGHILLPPGVEIIGLRLADFNPDHWFVHTAFRPLTDRPKEADTDVSIFYPLLKVTGPWGAPQDEPVKAPEMEPVP